MIIKYLKRNKGFVLLFAIVLVSIVLSLTIGISNVVFKEAQLTVSGTEANNAFFAADVGAECALYLDKDSFSPFVNSNPPFPLDCAGVSFYNPSSSFPDFGFTVFGLNPDGQGCANVTVTKDVPFPGGTEIVSKGYNRSADSSCSSGSNRVERELFVSY